MTKDYSNCVFLDKYPGYAICPEGKVINIRRGKAVRTKVQIKQPDGRIEATLVRRIIAEVFIPNPSGLKHVRNLDGDTSNNHPDNLAWVNAGYTLTEDQVRSIYALTKSSSDDELAYAFNVSASQIRYIKRGKTWKHLYEEVGEEWKATPNWSNNAKLTEDQVRVIYELLLKGEKVEVVAHSFEVSSGCISCIKRGKTWKHLYHLYTEGLKEQEENRNV